MESKDINKKFIESVKKIVYTVLESENLLRGNMRLGKVQAIMSDYRLSVYVDGSNVSQVIPCDPDRVFVIGDEVWVEFINGDSKNKFVVGKRATGTESIHKPI